MSSRWQYDLLPPIPAILSRTWTEIIVSSWEMWKSFKIFLGFLPTKKVVALHWPKHKIKCAEWCVLRSMWWVPWRRVVASGNERRNSILWNFKKKKHPDIDTQFAGHTQTYLVAGIPSITCTRIPIPRNPRVPFGSSQVRKLLTFLSLVSNFTVLKAENQDILID